MRCRQTSTEVSPPGVRSILSPNYGGPPFGEEKPHLQSPSVVQQKRTFVASPGLFWKLEDGKEEDKAMATQQAALSAAWPEARESAAGLSRILLAG